MKQPKVVSLYVSTCALVTTSGELADYYLIFRKVMAASIHRFLPRLSDILAGRGLPARGFNKSEKLTRSFYLSYSTAYHASQGVPTTPDYQIPICQDRGEYSIRPFTQYRSK